MCNEHIIAYMAWMTCEARYIARVARENGEPAQGHAFQELSNLYASLHSRECRKQDDWAWHGPA
jgi:hypothetical protein